jgi:Cu2+-exporting ATPase
VLAPWGINISPAFGALLMSLSTVIVAINAQLLRGTDLAETIEPLSKTSHFL